MKPGKGLLWAYEDWFEVIATIIQWALGTIFGYFFIGSLYLIFLIVLGWVDIYYWPVIQLWGMLK